MEMSGDWFAGIWIATCLALKRILSLANTLAIVPTGLPHLRQSSLCFFQCVFSSQGSCDCRWHSGASVVLERWIPFFLSSWHHNHHHTFVHA